VFAQHHPLSLTISITFEQSYSDIDGDSASAAELYAVLSSLSGIPIKQGVAVTGSVNQKGRIQAIGSVNQKVEGFFEVCREKGLTGEQGVIILSSNVQNLMLPRNVIDAVRKNSFTFTRSSTVEEGIEILTGIRAGSPNAEGLYLRRTAFGEVQKKLKIYAERPPGSEESGATLIKERSAGHAAAAHSAKVLPVRKEGIFHRESATRSVGRISVSLQTAWWLTMAT
jgi:hypothetical protein